MEEIDEQGPSARTNGEGTISTNMSKAAIKEQVYKLIKGTKVQNDLEKRVYRLGKQAMSKRIQTINPDHSILFLTILNDENSFAGGRTAHDYFQLLSFIQDPKLFDANIGLLVSDFATFQKIQSLIESWDHYEWPFAQTITLLHRPILSNTPAVGEERHSDHFQMERRQILAVLRNTLLYSSLEDEDYVVWIDADIIKIPKILIPKMIHSGLDIITPKCQAGPWMDYDGNAWAGTRNHPTENEREVMKSSGTSGGFVPKGGKRIGDLNPNNGTEFIPLDAVGGTFLFAKAEIYRQGISFPVYYIIGADWDLKQGWDGIETEGLCYIAKTRGYQCYGMPLMNVDHFH